MISTLHIKNVGIINDLSIDFNEGFNVLTGETGAGKTLIIESILALTGGRFSKDMIRKGEEYSLIEASIFYPENEFSEDGNIIVSREIYSNGRNTCKINGKLVTVNELKNAMSKIINIHGQHDNQNLLNNLNHIIYLDKYIGESLNCKKETYRNLFNRYHEIKENLKNNFGDEKQKERELDLLKYQYNEIDMANLKIGEDVLLEEKYNLILNSEKLSKNLEEANANIKNNAIEALSNSIKCFEAISDFDNSYKEKLLELRSIYYELQESARDISNLCSKTDFDDDQRYEIEKRLDIIEMLKRKYGSTIEEILIYKENVAIKIEKIENLDEINQKLKEELKQIEFDMQKICNEMNEIRTKYAQILSDNVNKELNDLEMQNANFKIEICKQDKFNLNGNDCVYFLIRTNLGDEYKELSKIVSGGEMSRIMLAIKTVLADVDDVPVLIFDEIDTGISGKTSKAVADKMNFISKKRQILCITHLATIAAKGKHNYYIYKEVENENTKTNIRKLNEEEIIYEIARISNGDVTDISIQNAKELRKAG